MSGERYTPTPEEIREACEAIQAEWDEREERSRRVCVCAEVMPPEVRINAAG